MIATITTGPNAPGCCGAALVHPPQPAARVSHRGLAGVPQVDPAADLRGHYDRAAVDVLRDLRDHFAGEQARGVGMTTYMLVTYGAFGVIGAACSGSGCRWPWSGQGWMRLKRVAPMPPLAYFVAKVVMSLAGHDHRAGHVHPRSPRRRQPSRPAAVGRGGAGAGRGCAAVLGDGPAFGLVGPNSAPAVLNLAWLPMAFVLWIPISQLPDVVQSVAVALPPYHFAALALGTIGASEGGSPVVHAAAMLGFRCCSWSWQPGVPSRRGTHLRMRRGPR